MYAGEKLKSGRTCKVHLGCSHLLFRFSLNSRTISGECDFSDTTETF